MYAVSKGMREMNYKGDELYWIAICDDEISSVREIKKILLEGEMEPGEFKISVFSSGIDLMKASVSRYDLLILDIIFPGENGREIADEYRAKNKDGLFVFCTGKESPVPEDFVNRPYRYMRKDKTKQMRKYLLETIGEMYRRRNLPQLHLTEGKRSVIMNVEDILYLEIAKNGCNIYYYDRDKEIHVMKVKERVKELYPRLHAYGFEFPHNSYLVNCHYLKRWDTHELEFVNGARMSISRARERKFKEACMKYIV